MNSIVNNKEKSSIWNIQQKKRTQIVKDVCKTLESSYDISRLGNPTNPLDDLLFIIISSRTTPKLTIRVYNDIKNNFNSWDDLLETGNNKLQLMIKPAGLSKIKAEYIILTLKKIKKDFGTFNLDSLEKKSDKEIQAYLILLPGVSEKIAKCIMLYTMNKSVLPVDAHVYRISKKLGWTIKNRADQCHKELETLVPPNNRFTFHVNCIQHGRLICRPSNPRCNQCCISHFCLYFIT